MGSVKPPDSVLPVMGLIYGPAFDRARIAPLITSRLGPIALQSEPAAFDQTNYYAPEMGNGLIRQWWIFEKLAAPDALADLKLWTNKLELEHLTPANGRLVNLDPGILTLNNLVLASTKNYSHRIYLRQGIYAEVTLIYRHGQFQPLAWTYPDYKTDAARAFFLKGRALLKELPSKE